MGLEEEPKKASWKMLLISCVVGLVVGGALIGGITYQTFKKQDKKEITEAQIGNWIENASDLVSERYHYTDFKDYTREGTKIAGFTIPLTEEQTLIVYSGTISVGLDVSEVSCSIDESKKQITLTLPEPKIIAHEVDHSSVKSYSVKDSIFHEKTFEEFAEVINYAQEEKEENLLTDDKFLKNVSKDAQNSLTELLTAVGVTDDYTIVFK